jgi:hypothetical protein
MTETLRGRVKDGRKDPRSAKGVERRREIRAEDDAEVKRIAGDLLASLPQPPTVADELKAELIGRTACKVRRLAEQGRESLGERRLLESLLRDSAFGQVAAQSPAERQHGREIAEAYGHHNAAWARAASREPSAPTDEETATDEVADGTVNAA